MIKKIVTILLAFTLVITAIPTFVISATENGTQETMVSSDVNTVQNDEKMLHVTYESYDMTDDVLMLEISELAPNIEYAISFDCRFLSGELDEAVNFVLCGHNGDSKIVKGTPIRASANRTAFDSCSVNGTNIKYTFTLSEDEISDYVDFYAGFYFLQNPRMITEFYISNFMIYRTSDLDKTNLFIKEDFDDMSGWHSHWTVATDGTQQFGTNNVSYLDYTATYESYDEELFATEKDIIHYGDCNFDGLIDARDVVNAKKRSVGISGYVSASDFDNDGTISAIDLSKIRKHLLDDESIVWEEGKSYILSINDMVGGADKEASELRNTISSNSDTVSASTGSKTYYISEDGNDSNNGLSESSPIPISQIANLSLKSGDVILLKRGDTFRINKSLNFKTGVSFGTYGEGDKPIISGSLKDYADKNIWTTEDGFLWETTLDADMAANIVFDNGLYVGEPKLDISEVDDDGEFFFDSENKKLYLYLRQYNPGIYFDSIEISSLGTAFICSNVSNVTLENISIKYFGIHAMNMMVSSNINISGCELSWIGGAYTGEEAGGRYGNGIQFWDSASNCNVSNNYLYQIYDAALTFQGNDGACYSDLSFNNNLVEYSSMNFEFWDEATVEFSNIDFSNNILRFAGYGWGGTQRSNKHNQGYILGWYNTYNNVSNFNITNNLFDIARCNFFYAVNLMELLNISNNTYFQTYGSPYSVNRSSLAYAKGQSSFETAIKSVDSEASVYWVGKDYDSPNDISSSYYVKNGGNGDGRTANSPASTVYDVINTINADGLTVGDTANIYIMQRSDWNVAEDGTTVQNNITAWTAYGTKDLPVHTAEIVVQAYDASVKTYLAFHDATYKNQSLYLGGPTVFKNITLVSPYSDWVGIVADGNSLTYGSGTYFSRMTSANWNGTLEASFPALYTVLDNNASKETYTKPQNFTIETEKYDSGTGTNRSIHISGMGAAKPTYKEDVTLTFNNNNLKPKLYWGSTNQYAGTTFEKNLNINVKSAATLTNVQGAVALTVNGGLQYIVNSDTAVTGDVSTFTNITATLGKWFITNASGYSDFLSFTETAGTYTVKSGYEAVATNAAGDEYCSTNGVLVIPSGIYTVKEYIPPKTGNYYVLNGAADGNDGKTKDTPVATVYKAIEAMNADGYGEGDSVNIYIMQRSGWNVAEDGTTVQNNITAWTAYGTKELPAHTAEIVVQAYDTSVKTYLAFHDATYQNQNLHLAGPTVFKNITLVSPYSDWVGIIADGNSLTYGSGTYFSKISSSSWDGKLEASFPALYTVLDNNASKETYTKPQNFTIETEKYDSGTGTNRSIHISGKGAAKPTYKEDVTLTFNNSNLKPKLYWGSTNQYAGTTFEKNLNINVKSATALTNVQGSVALTINGGLQYIVNSDTAVTGDISAFTNITATLGKWFITNHTGDSNIISFTETAGKYAVNVEEGYVVVATDADGNEVLSSDGILIITAGIWDLTVRQAPTDTYEPYINYRRDLSNTYSKLTTGEKELNVVYFGGSVTAGTGSSDAEQYSWRALIGKWLQNTFPDATVNNINKACGESGTFLGSYRVAKDVISENPDLLFIEYSINDYYDGATYERAALQYETIIRQVKIAIPDCDIVTILVTDSNCARNARTENGGKLHTQAQAHEDIAAIYNIPTIHVGRALADSLPSDWTYAEDWKDVVAIDIVHPTDTGYELYYNVIKEYFNNCLVHGGYDSTSPTPVEELPEMVSDYLLDGNITFIQPSAELLAQSEELGGKGFIFEDKDFSIKGYKGFFNAKDTNEENIFAVKFTGTELISVNHNTNDDLQYWIKVDDNEWSLENYYHMNPETLVTGLESGEHIVYFKPVLDTTDSDVDWMWIGGFFSRDESMQTVKK